MHLSKLSRQFFILRYSADISFDTEGMSGGRMMSPIKSRFSFCAFNTKESVAMVPVYPSDGNP